MSNIIECRKLTQYFDDAGVRVDVFHDLDLQIKKGERVAIVGASGSGKSTLLYMLGGLDRIKSGTVLIDGQDIVQLNAKKLGELRKPGTGLCVSVSSSAGRIYRSGKCCHAFTDPR